MNGRGNSGLINYYQQLSTIIMLMEKSEVNEPVFSHDSLETKWRLSASSHKKVWWENPVLVKKKVE